MEPIADSAVKGGFGRPALPRAVRIVIGVGSPALLVVMVALWLLGAGPFLRFAFPIVLASLVISLLMAIYWREWRALPLSLVFVLLSVRCGIELGLQSGMLMRTGSLDLLADMLLWSSLPVTFGTIAGLWRIFENHTRFEAAQRELLENERRYRHVIENATDALYTADVDGRLTLANAAAARLFGRRVGDLTNTSFFELVSVETRRTMSDALETMRDRNVKAFYSEFPITRRDGSERWVGQNVQALFDGRQIKGFQAVLRDITERREAQEALKASETRFRSLFETMSEGVIQTRSDGRIVFSNPAAERILGLTRPTLEARLPADLASQFQRGAG